MDLQALQQSSGINNTRFITTVSGKNVDLMHPKVEQIDIHDIGNHLAFITRFNGPTKTPYGISIAAHSFAVADILWHKSNDPLLAMHGLLKNAYQAYIGHLTLPVKSLPNIYKPWDDMCKTLQETILRSLKIPDTTDVQKIKIEYVNALVLEVEIKDFVPYINCETNLQEENSTIDLEELRRYLTISPCHASNNFSASYDFLKTKIDHLYHP